jgi:hypothetical protein
MVSALSLSSVGLHTVQHALQVRVEPASAERRVWHGKQRLVEMESQKPATVANALSI